MASLNLYSLNIFILICPNLTFLKKYIYDVLEATPPTAQEQKQDPLLANEWSSLSQLKEHLIREGQTIITHFDGFQIVVKDKDGYHYS